MVGKNFLVHKALGEAKNSEYQAETVLFQAKYFQWDNGTDIEKFISWQVASLAHWSTLSLPRFPLWLSECKKSECHCLQDCTE
ncbi:hypothetical protein TNCV_777841 [Trichonephila clavipes]|nr:hypothetical protein TNCV_777841 [Trichonephila clavipes]